MNDLFRGAMAGLAGTATMSTAMTLAKAAGLLPGEPPPRKVSRRFLETVRARETMSQAGFEASWIGQHFAYGATMGAAYALVERRLPIRHPLIAGPLFGAALWVFGYAGWLPLSGLHPAPQDDCRRRLGMNVLAHLIYGTTTASVVLRTSGGWAPCFSPDSADATNRIDRGLSDSVVV